MNEVSFSLIVASPMHHLVILSKFSICALLLVYQSLQAELIYEACIELVRGF